MRLCPFIVCISLALASSATATEMADCFISVYGEPLLTGPCALMSSKSIIAFESTAESQTAPNAAHLTVHVAKEGDKWNASLRGLDTYNKEHTNTIGPVTPLNACWVNEIARICAWNSSQANSPPAVAQDAHGKAECYISVDGRGLVAGPCIVEKGDVTLTFRAATPFVMVAVGLQTKKAVLMARKDPLDGETLRFEGLGDVTPADACWVNKRVRICAWPSSQADSPPAAAQDAQGGVP